MQKNVFCQDVHFSQFFSSPLNLNPSHTGNFIGDWRISNIYRNQWSQIGNPFQTVSFGFDNQIYIKDEKLSLGLVYLNDQSGGSYLVSDKVYFCLAYHKNVGKNILSGGVQTGYVKKSPKRFTFPDQFDKNTGTFNPDLNTGATFSTNEASYLDINVGLNLKLNLGKFKPEIGGALFHVTKPNETLLGNDDVLPIRKVAHFGGYLDLGKGKKIEPNVLFMEHEKASDLLMGANFVLPVGSDKMKSIYVGGYYRDGLSRNYDAGIIVMGMNFNKLDIGVSYDINISGLSEITNNKGAFEISIIYTSFSSIIKEITVPCERY